MNASKYSGHLVSQCEGRPLGLVDTRGGLGSVLACGLIGLWSRGEATRWLQVPFLTVCTEVKLVALRDFSLAQFSYFPVCEL